MSKIASALMRLLDKHRVVTWYDEDLLLEEEDDFELTNATLLEIKNNEFALKHHVLREEPKSRFVLYSKGKRPADLENWLLDIELSGAVFQADKVALWLSELGLGVEFADVIRPHEAFFGSKRRTEQLAELISKTDSADDIHLKMTGICAETEPHLEHVLERLFADLRSGKEERYKTLERCRLDDKLWNCARNQFGYVADEPGLKDLSIKLFLSSFARDMGENSELTNDAVLFMGRWKDSSRYRGDYEAFAADYEKQLGIENQIQNAPFGSLLKADTFDIIDRKVLSDLVRSVSEHTIQAPDVERIVQTRRQTHWFARYEQHYSALAAASTFFDVLQKSVFSLNAPEQGVRQYAEQWYKLDQLYRHFHFSVTKAGHATMFAELIEEVDQRYTSQYLVPLSDAWQAQVDAQSTWLGAGDLGLAHELRDRLRDHRSRDVTLVVLISDALRFEVGEELTRRILAEDRYEAAIEPAISPLPSFTQLGMASMLPHDSIDLSADGAAMVDGLKTTGLAARQKALSKGIDGTVRALKVSEFLDMKSEQGRELIKTNDVVFLYHNRIDAVGDKRDTEEHVFEACERTIEELVLTVKKLFSANASNVLVTADHGFLYQDHAVEDLDYAVDPPEGDISVVNRRFVLGHGLKETPVLKHYTSQQLGLAGDVEVLIPRGIYRLRQQGSGSRFVHGGATLQEVVVPMLHVTKKRESDVAEVEVDVISGSSASITTGQLSVTLYQMRPVSEKRHAIALRVGIYAKDGTLLSDQQLLTFDSSSKHERDRELKTTLILRSESDKYNGQYVELRLEQRIADTSHWRTYKTRPYTLKRSFTTDIDF